jgi:DHA2 family multidrug resistance protein
VFLVSVIGFTVASALCGMATSLGGIVAARLLQGVFGAALVPLSQAVLLDINPPQKVGQAMAIWGAGIMVGPILGPLLGGWLTENFDWRWVFFINLPVGLRAVWGIARYLPENRPQGEKLDMFGFVTLSLAIGMLQLLSGPRRAARLVRLVGDQARGGRAGGLRLLRGPHLDGAGRVLLRPRPAERPQLRHRPAVRLHRRHGAVRDDGAAAHLPAGADGLPGRLHRQVTAPRGIGTMIAMIIVGRLVQRVDLRLIMATGASASRPFRSGR